MFKSYDYWKMYDGNPHTEEEIERQIDQADFDYDSWKDDQVCA